MGVKLGLSHLKDYCNTDRQCFRTGCKGEYLNARATGGSRKLRTEELHNLYSSPNIIRMRWVGLVACVEEMINVHNNLVGTPEGKGPLRRHGNGWEDTIKIYIKEIGHELLD
jgi:hypothetical protein